MLGSKNAKNTVTAGEKKYSKLKIAQYRKISTESLADKYDAEFELDFDTSLSGEIEYYWEKEIFKCLYQIP